MRVIFVAIFIGFIAATLAVLQCPKDGTDDNVLLPNPEDCTSYFSCKNGFPYLEICPTGLNFDVKTLACVDPMEATCADPESSTPEIPEGETPETPPVDCPEQNGPDDNVLLPNSKDCHTFYQCVYGHPYLMHCPKGLVFNPQKKYCDYLTSPNCNAIL